MGVITIRSESDAARSTNSQSVTGSGLHILVLHSGGDVDVLRTQVDGSHSLDIHNKGVTSHIGNTIERTAQRHSVTSSDSDTVHLVIESSTTESGATRSKVHVTSGLEHNVVNGRLEKDVTT